MEQYRKNTRPSSGWTAASVNQPSALTRSALETYYLHMFAKDRAGNEAYRCFGPFTIFNTEPGAQPQTVAHDQYYFVLPEGRISGKINATPDLGSEIEEYVFGALDDPAQGTLAAAGGADSSFTFEADAAFGETSFTVTVKDKNSLSTQVTVYLRQQAESSENERVDRLVSTIPAFEAIDPDQVTLRVAGSTNESVLPVGNCDFELGAGGEMRLLYEPVPYRYGQATVTLKLWTVAEMSLKRWMCPFTCTRSTTRPK